MPPASACGNTRPRDPEPVMPEQFCPACNRETLLLKEAVYEGFTRVGERLKCAVCGETLEAPVEPPARKMPAIFSDDDRPKTPQIFDEGENRVICRYCRHYIVNPFKQRCGLHGRDVDATDTCPQFETQPE